MRIRGSVLALSALAAAAFAAGPARGADEFYKGKTIQIVVGNPAGTGFDLYARAVARFMGKYIPGEPAIVVQNMPGAAGLRALQFLSVNAPKDGTYIGTFNANLINLSVLEPKTTETIDFTSMNWLGNMSAASKVCFSWTDSGITSLQALQNKQLVIGGSAKGSGDIYGALLKAVFGDKIKVVVGYGTNADTWLAFERGELTGNCTGWTQLPRKNPEWIRDGKISVLVQFAKKPIRELPKVPLIYDLPLSDDLRGAIEFLTQSDAIVRPFAAPPGVPAERVEILKQAFAKTAADAEFLAYAEKADLEIIYMDADGLRKTVEEIRRTPTKSVEVARKLAE